MAEYEIVDIAKDDSGNLIVKIKATLPNGAEYENTMTYPPDWEDKDRWKGHLDDFMMRMMDSSMSKNTDFSKHIGRHTIIQKEKKVK